MRLRKEAQGTPLGVEREKLIRQARKAEAAARIQEWLSSPGLQPPKGVKSPGSHPRSNNMAPHIPEELSTRIDWRTFAIMSNTMPPRDPNDDDDEDEDEDEEEDRTDEPPVVREPDED